MKYHPQNPLVLQGTVTRFHQPSNASQQLANALLQVLHGPRWLHDPSSNGSTHANNATKPSAWWNVKGEQASYMFLA